MRFVVAALGLAACGRIGFDPAGGPLPGDDGGTVIGAARAIETGSGASCAILETGALWCWGRTSGSRVPLPSPAVEVDASLTGRR
jgi:hypothetical protein